MKRPSVAVLDNPFWHALTTDQASFAVVNGGVRSFSGEVAPFCAVERDGQAIDPQHLADAMWDGAMRYFVGALPVLPPGCLPPAPITLLQMACVQVAGVSRAGTAIRDLGVEDVDAMLALTRLAFPGFFRRRTVEMGRYIGIVESGGLVAMGGERLAMPGYRELTAICTHPAHTGKGYARMIVRRLTSRILAEDRVPFLHVRDTNTSARRLYESLGFEVVNAVRLLTVPPMHAEP